MDIYIDILFFNNLISDFLILSLCENKFTYDKISNLRKICASITGAVYACLFVFDMPDFFYSAPFRIMVSIGMCATAFLPCTLTDLVKKCIVFHIISIIFCGIFYTVNQKISYELSDTLWIFCISLSFLVCKIAFLKIKSDLYSKNCRIKIEYKKNKVVFNGMIDSGNSLIDPVSLMPVLIIDERILKELFSPSITKNNLCEFVDSKDFKVIPYKTISDSGVTYGFLPDKLICNNKKIKNVIVAVSPSQISTNALISTKII